MSRSLRVANEIFTAERVASSVEEDIKMSIWAVFYNNKESNSPEEFTGWMHNYTKSSEYIYSFSRPGQMYPSIIKWEFAMKDFESLLDIETKIKTAQET